MSEIEIHDRQAKVEIQEARATRIEIGLGGPKGDPGPLPDSVVETVTGFGVDNTDPANPVIDQEAWDEVYATKAFAVAMGAAL